MSDSEKKIVLQNLGFHGDKYLINLVDIIIKNYNISYFIETGTNVGSTLKYVGENYNVNCLSCEPDMVSYKEALKNIKEITNKNINIFNIKSQSFIQHIKEKMDYLYKEPTLFWLDAHGWGFEWPLQEEISFITKNFEKGFVLIDDFKVPHLPCFGFDYYDGYECSYEYIEDFIRTDSYELYYPNYTEHTSSFHPLRGWGLIVIGEEFRLTKDLEKKVLRHTIK